MIIGICGGASGHIGWELGQYLHDKGEKVWGTYCTNHRGGLAQFDLRKDSFHLFDKSDFVVIAAGYAKIQFCENNRIEAFWLNVYRTRELLQHLSDKGIPALFISSDLAGKGNTTYGKYKRQVEKFMEENLVGVGYIRPGKINDENIQQLCEEIYATIKSRCREKVKV